MGCFGYIIPRKNLTSDLFINKCCSSYPFRQIFTAPNIYEAMFFCVLDSNLVHNIINNAILTFVAKTYVPQ